MTEPRVAGISDCDRGFGRGLACLYNNKWAVVTSVIGVSYDNYSAIPEEQTHPPRRGPVAETAPLD